MTHYLLCFAAGFLGSFHCIGMCGGFACAIGHGSRGHGANLLRHLLYNVGRLSTYCFLGGLAGGLGQVLCTQNGMTVSLLGGSLETAQRLLAVLAGLLMVAMALQFFGLWQGRLTAVGFGTGALAASLRNLLTAPKHGAPLAFGVANGFLPCPLVYAFVAQAADTGAPLPGCLTMAAFGFGTFPAMLAMGGIGRMLNAAWRRRGVRLAGAFILVLGLVTLVRGVLPPGFYHLLHSGFAAPTGPVV